MTVDRWALRAIAIVATWFALAACDPSGKGYEDVRLAKLKVGESTEQDVRKLFGNPEAVRDLPSGKGLVYPLGPEGPYTLLVAIGADGKYQGRENLLTRANFDRIYPGMKQVQVLALLGRPGSTESYRAKQQVAWIWKFVEGGGSAKAFVTIFDASGSVVSTAVEDQPRRTGG
jgi:outer membrane protein assembly factor BamE (lipoprotein component of BamABCDE complex)